MRRFIRIIFYGFYYFAVVINMHCSATATVTTATAIATAIATATATASGTVTASASATALLQEVLLLLQLLLRQVAVAAVFGVVAHRAGLRMTFVVHCTQVAPPVRATFSGSASGGNRPT